MAKHLHVHIHRAPTRDRAPVARAVRSISRDQHAAEDVSQLVGVLMQIIAEKKGTATRDAGFDESKVKRDEGGRFSTQQHAAAAEEHTKAAAEHKKAGNKEAAKAHETAANHHGLAAQTGKALHAETAHNATKQALAVGSSSAPASNASQGAKPMKATASGARAATHELLSSGHPFSVDELCKATGVPKSTMTTVLSAFKNPKYAGKLGTLAIVKRPDGMYHVQKKEGAGLAPKPGPDGQPMGKHPELAAAERRVAENPRTTSSPGLRSPGEVFGGAFEAAGKHPPKPGPDGQPMGKHPELAASLERGMANRAPGGPGLANLSGPVGPKKSTPALGDATHKKLQKAHEDARNSYELKRDARRAKGHKGVMSEAESKAYYKMNAAMRALDDHERAARGK